MSAPIICELCLGDSPDIRVTKIPNGADCKICTLPFTVFHFKKDPRSSTIIRTIACERCAKQRNVCQCCMLDLAWHISIDERDQIISLIKGHEVKTREAQNEMMKRFVALKNGNAKLGGAEVTGDRDQLAQVMAQLEETLTRESEQKEDATNNLKRGSSNLGSTSITHIWKDLPMSETFSSENCAGVQSFFLFGIDTSIPEWQIDSTIADIVGDENWKQTPSTSLIVNHKATCGGIKFKSQLLSDKFVKELISRGCLTRGGKTKGILEVLRFRVFVLPWRQGFKITSFGRNIKENIKLRNALQAKISSNSFNLVTEGDSPGGKKLAKSAAANKHKRVGKKNKKSKRVSNLEL
ncbi:Pre-mRNA-splicing factor ECM2 KNAG_0J00860 [Huiozyma naganishii CBS 8797]|uniref:Pre-mRNA-splicing factor SLT11 n=1 Tax=Huiozyma naganishii (strain ATCC MYA-139 / BCRC 22969 / CBS 8797 / KCTC 17520 / NBRC 10181 / NCYC 3082 / Yp74L-3) TaxID=1071383 RepID=J7RQS6_HUIN7|nr:hypothetical protein KNAG_0J00860 [Kazachstania naganishii CBS 8797]CCK72168.1 hypothetical protein KNAG_0J00860 [Kazachstania naganishii CBS 8797]